MQHAIISGHVNANAQSLHHTHQEPDEYVLLVTVVKLSIRHVLAPAARISQQPVPDQFTFGRAGVQVGRVGVNVVRLPILLVGRVVFL